jgi:hypothetical protein
LKSQHHQTIRLCKTHLTVQGRDPVRRLYERSRVLSADRKNKLWGTLPTRRLCEASKDCMYVINATESFSVPSSLQRIHIQ